MADYPGAVDAKTWAAHADAGCTTWTAGTAPSWTAFIDPFPAAAFAAENGTDLVIWHGRNGHQAEAPVRGDVLHIAVPEMGEKEMEIG